MRHSSIRLVLKTHLLSVAILVPLILAAAFLSEPAQAQAYKVLYTFKGGWNGFAASEIIVAPNGTIYGSAGYGVGCACNLIFSFADNRLTVLHRWSEPSGRNEVGPQGLLLDRNTNVLFGTTQFGGPSSNNCFADAGNACGSAFSYDLAAKKYKELYDFTGTPDGMDPSGIQVLTSNYLYGITWGRRDKRLGILLSS